MPEYDGPERRGSWAVSKSLNLSHLLVTVSMVFGGISYVSGIDTEVQLLETKFLSLERQVEKSEERTSIAFNELKGMIQRLETKIDRLTIRG
tara:strand:+ start:80 stop:355 length:276 start_codon:yes stop_codon:yes gene_type:complete